MGNVNIFFSGITSVGWLVEIVMVQFSSWLVGIRIVQKLVAGWLGLEWFSM